LTALEAIRRLGLFGSHTPKSYGGLGLSMLGNCLVIEEMARANIAYFYAYSMNVHIASKGIELRGSCAGRGTVDRREHRFSRGARECHEGGQLLIGFLFPDFFAVHESAAGP
jgi:alkylation response protein AidB-like acyl-CoA dehydrogenase